MGPVGPSRGPGGRCGDGRPTSPTTKAPDVTPSGASSGSQASLDLRLHGRTSAGALGGHRSASSDPRRPLGGRRGRSLGLPSHRASRTPVRRGAGVELPGVEPGSRGPVDEGATCVGSGCSRTRCSGARQLPGPHHPALSPRAGWSQLFGWIPVMSIGPPYGASEGDRHCVSGSEGQVSVLGDCLFPRGISEARAGILGTLPHRRQ
jgi:hypothetical protein